MFNPDSSHNEPLSLFLDGDKRLIFSGLPVFLTFSLLFSHFYFQNHGSRMMPLPDVASALTAQEDKIYPVLVEQKYSPEAVRDQIRALSDVTAEGTGHLTKKSGFHTLTSYDTLSFSRSGERNPPGQEGEREPRNPGDETNTREGDEGPRSPAASRAARAGSARSGDRSPVEGNEENYTIPANYRFQQDMALRYDDSPRLSIARQELAGFRYFQQMLRQIRDTFAPPGMNYAYRDSAGYVVNQPIKPQQVQVLFSLDRKGFVRDVRVVSSMGQTAVDEACINVLRGRNFGPPPEEVLAKGNIFGINFIFPPVWGR